MWRYKHSRKDCVFVITGDSNAHGMQSMDVARVLAFFSFRLNSRHFPCAVICWFDRSSDIVDPDTGIWTVRLLQKIMRRTLQ